MSPNDPNVQDPSLDQGVLSAAQVPGSPNHDSPFASVIPAAVQLTDAIYWASKPKAVQDLNKLQGQPPNPVQPGTPLVAANPRYAAALALSTQGYQIDVWIDALGNDPVVTMLLRQEMNIASVPTWPSMAYVKTSLNPSDYPPFYPPAPPAPVNNSVVGGLQGFEPTLGGTVYSAGPGARAAAAGGQIFDGSNYEQNGVTYKAHVTMGLMGEAIWFTREN